MGLLQELGNSCPEMRRRPRRRKRRRGTPGAQAFGSGDNAWMLTSSALVLMMTAPGLAMFYGGLVRKKNVRERDDAMRVS